MPGLMDKRLVFVIGKGGVGKTTVAAALGLAAARRGKRTIVCEVAGQERVSRAFKREGVGYSETELAEGLHAISIDPNEALEEYLEQQVGKRLGALLFHNRIFEYLAAAAPGVREFATIAKVWELAQLERRTRKAAPYDLVIVDTPATGHGLGILRTPRAYGEIAGGGPIRRRAEMIDSFVTNKRQTAVLAVALPEDMPVNETIEFRDALSEQMGMDTYGVVVNALMPERFSREEAERIEEVDGGHGNDDVAAALRAALAHHRRARSQRSYLRRLRREFDEIVTLPFLFEAELGLDEYERLAVELERKL